MKFWKKIAACGLSVALAVGTGVLLTGCGGSEKDAAARMQVDINPSVEFILDADNKVLSVTALNERRLPDHRGRGFCRKNRGGSRGNDGKHFYRCGVSR